MEPINESETLEERREQYRKTIVIPAVIVMMLIAVFEIIWLFSHLNMHYNTGMDAYIKGDYKSAAAEFQQDVAKAPNHSLGYYYLGKSLEGERRYSDATTAYQQAYQVEAATDHPDMAFANKCLSHANACREKMRSK